MPFGVTFNELIHSIGGGMHKVSELKAIQIGGASGSILPANVINESISFENLLHYQAGIGAGGIVALDENSCVIEMARYYVEFSQNESCGFCVPCREGTQQILTILTRITQGKGSEEDIENYKTFQWSCTKLQCVVLAKKQLIPFLQFSPILKKVLEHIIDKNVALVFVPALYGIKSSKKNVLVVRLLVCLIAP